MSSSRRALWLAVFEQAVRDLTRPGATSTIEGHARLAAERWIESHDFEQVASMIGINEDVAPALRRRLRGIVELPVKERAAAIQPLMTHRYTSGTETITVKRERKKQDGMTSREKRRAMRRAKLRREAA